MKARVQGSQVNLLFIPESTGVLPIDLGEIDEFTATQTSEVVKRRPMGYSIPSVTYKYDGWDLSFSGGKVDWKLARFLFQQDRSSRIPGRTTCFSILETIYHYDSTLFGRAIEQYTYTNVVLFGLDKKARSGEEVTEEVRGFCPKREIGPIDTSLATLDGLRFNAQTFTATTTDLAAAVAGALPPEISAVVNTIRSRPF